MINQFIAQDRKIGSKAGKPEGLLVNCLNSIEKNLLKSVGKPDREINQSVDYSFYKNDESLDKSVVNDLVDNLREILLQDKYRSNITSEKVDYYFANSNNLDFRKHSEIINRIIHDEKLEKIFRNYFGVQPQIDHISTGWTKPAQSDNIERLSSGWHLDAHLRSFKTRAFVFLSDETVRNAPIEIVNRRETIEIMKENSLEEINENPDIVYDNANVREFKGDKGDFMIFNPATHLHTGNVPTSGEALRKALMLDYTPDYSKFI